MHPWENGTMVGTSRQERPGAVLLFSLAAILAMRCGTTGPEAASVLSVPPSDPMLTISNVSASRIRQGGAMINSTTSPGGNSQVEYGTTTSYGSMSTLDPRLVTSHAQSLRGLNASNSYRYPMHSEDANGNNATSGDNSFATFSAGAMAAGSPVLAFSDLTSGPNTGNTDTSKGQTSGVNGAIVSVWGLKLGESQGGSTISVHGATASTVYYWGNALPPWSPANLHNGHQNMQMVIFQIPSTAASGSGAISVNVNGQTSNSIPFTVRSGRIFFVATTGKDGHRGTFQSPLRTIQTAKDVANTAGDTIYVEDNVNALRDTQGFGVAVRMNHSATQAAPIALVSYPGAANQIGTPGLDPMQFVNTGNGPDTSFITVSKFTIIDNGNGLYVKEGGRLVGNYQTAPNGCGDWGANSSRGNDLYWLGNEWTNVGLGPTCNQDSLYHVLYISGIRSVAKANIEQNRVIEWNYFHDNKANTAIQIFTETESGTSDLIENHTVDHNVIVNQRADGIKIGSMVSGITYVYDNLLINTGQGPSMNDQGTHYTCIDLRAGDSRATQNVIHVFNNTCYNSGFIETNGTYSSAWGVFEIVGTFIYTLDFHNNIAYQNKASIPYITSNSENFTSGFTPTAAQMSHNLWFGAGRAPAFDANSLNVDPRFMDKGAIFRLQTTSPAVDSGTDVGRSFVTSDLDGTTQPSRGAFDRGAYELP